MGFHVDELELVRIGLKLWAIANVVLFITIIAYALINLDEILLELNIKKFYMLSWNPPKALILQNWLFSLAVSCVFHFAFSAVYKEVVKDVKAEREKRHISES